MSQGTKVNNRTRTGAPKKRDYGPTTENYPLSEAQGTGKFLQVAGEGGLQAIAEFWVLVLLVPRT
jgi:hypothetical protein